MSSASISEHLEVDTKKNSSLWWLKSATKNIPQNPQIKLIHDLTLPPKYDLEISSSIEEYLEKDKENEDASEADIGSIIEEITKLSSQSPIAGYEEPAGDKSVEEILQEAEKLYIENSKSFEQLSSKSRTSIDYSLSKSSSLSFKSKKSSPRSIKQTINRKSEDYSDDFSLSLSQSQVSSNRSNLDPNRDNNNLPVSEVNIVVDNYPQQDSNSNFDFSQKPQNSDHLIEDKSFQSELYDSFHAEPPNENMYDTFPVQHLNKNELYHMFEPAQVFDSPEFGKNFEDFGGGGDGPDVLEEKRSETTEDSMKEKVLLRQESVSDPEDDIEELQHEIQDLKIQLKETRRILEQNEQSLQKQSCGIQQQLDSTIEQLKDTQEQNTALQLQLANLTKTHQELKQSYDELINSKKNLELRIAEIDTNFIRCKSELITVKETNAKLFDSETNLKKQLEIEKLQSKTARLQNEKDGKCILDLNRQVKEMERIIQRKHPDSVSALIVASKSDLESPTARNLLESRIKQLENEASLREMQSNNVFTEIQEKFNQMKAKYESHIEDLETHVNDLKTQLRTKADTYDIYTQTYSEEPVKLTDNNIKEVYTIGTQTDYTKTPKIPPKKPEKTIDPDSHLIATIRGLQTDLTSKEKLINKMQKELDEMRKNNRRLQRDRETNLNNKIAVPEKKDNNKNNDKFIKTPETPSSDLDKDLRAIKDERDKMKAQLYRLEEDYQNLKTKRLQDLNTLQEAHERELTTYMSNIGPMREQLDVQQISITTLQSQLASAKEELAILTVERDHLDARLKNLTMMDADRTTEDSTSQLSLQKKIAYLERRYEEREHRLRAIVHGLAQKQVSSSKGGCAQCASRQQQLIGYKAELDQLLATLRYLQ